MTMPQTYPTECRECHLTAGWPVALIAAVPLNANAIDVRCRACGHQWTQDFIQATGPEFGGDDVAAPVLLRRKPERRKGNDSRVTPRHADGPFRLWH